MDGQPFGAPAQCQCWVVTDPSLDWPRMGCQLAPGMVRAQPLHRGTHTWVSAVHWNWMPSRATWAGHPNRNSSSFCSFTLRLARLMTARMVLCMPSTTLASQPSTMPATAAARVSARTCWGAWRAICHLRWGMTTCATCTPCTRAAGGSQGGAPLTSTGRSKGTFSACWLNISVILLLSACPSPAVSKGRPVRAAGAGAQLAASQLQGGGSRAHARPPGMPCLVKGDVGEGVEQAGLEVGHHGGRVAAQGQDLQERGVADKVEARELRPLRRGAPQQGCRLWRSACMPPLQHAPQPMPALLPGRCTAGLDRLSPPRPSAPWSPGRPSGSSGTAPAARPGGAAAGAAARCRSRC